MDIELAQARQEHHLRLFVSPLMSSIFTILRMESIYNYLACLWKKVNFSHQKPYFSCRRSRHFDPSDPLQQHNPFNLDLSRVPGV